MYLYCVYENESDIKTEWMHHLVTMLNVNTLHCQLIAWTNKRINTSVGVALAVGGGAGQQIKFCHAESTSIKMSGHDISWASVTNMA